MANLEARNPPAAPTGVVARAWPGGFAVLWFLWSALLLAALVAGNRVGHGGGWPTALRMGSSVVLVVTAWWAFANWQGAARMFALAIAIGMTAGAIGDFFNAGLLRFVPLSDPTLGGIISFGLGHVAYIAGSLFLARRAGLNDSRRMMAAVLVWQLVGLAAWYGVVMLGAERRPLVWPALGYTLLLAGTAGVTLGLALQDRRLWPLAAGAALFLTSDLILAFELFRGAFAYDTECVWLTYGPGQMLIVFSTIAAAALLARRPNT
jgi:hypothetical protein